MSFYPETPQPIVEENPRLIRKSVGVLVMGAAVAGSAYFGLDTIKYGVEGYKLDNVGENLERQADAFAADGMHYEASDTYWDASKTYLDASGEYSSAAMHASLMGLAAMGGMLGAVIYNSGKKED